MTSRRELAERVSELEAAVAGLQSAVKRLAGKATAADPRPSTGDEK